MVVPTLQVLVVSQQLRAVAVSQRSVLVCLKANVGGIAFGRTRKQCSKNGRK